MVSRLGWDRVGLEDIVPLSVGKVVCLYYVFERVIIRAFLAFDNGDSGEKCVDCLIKC